MYLAAPPSDIAEIYSPITIALPDFERRRLDLVAETERRIAAAVMLEKRRVQERESKTACRHTALWLLIAAVILISRR